jgi:hypothetical protein
MRIHATSAFKYGREPNFERSRIPSYICITPKWQPNAIQARGGLSKSSVLA